MELQGLLEEFQQAAVVGLVVLLELMPVLVDYMAVAVAVDLQLLYKEALKAALQQE
jgi:hypothetical protein